MTKQEENKLRIQAQQRGYSKEQINQFVEFARAKEAKTAVAQVASPQAERGENPVKAIAKDAFKTLLVKPGARIGQLLAFGVGALTGNEAAKDQALGPQHINLGPLGSYDIEPTGTGPAAYKQIAKDAGKSALELVSPKAVTAVIKPAAKFISKGAGKVLSRGSKVVQEGVERVTSTLDEPTKTALNPTRTIPTENVNKLNPQRLVKEGAQTEKLYNRYLKQAQKSSTDMSQPSALDLAGSRAEEALRIIDDKLSRAGALKSSSLETTGSQLLRGTSKARQSLRQLVQERLGIRFNQKGIANAPGRLSKVDSADHALLKEVDDILAKLGSDAPLQKVDDAVDQIQDILYRRKANIAIQVNNKVEGILKQVLGELNRNLKRMAGGTYRKANTRYSRIIDVFEKLNKALGQDASKGGALMKRVFSPSDGGTKRLFQEVKRLTGIDLTKEATLAKLAMDTVGDPRSRNLLEQLDLLKPTGALGWIERAGKMILDKAKNPEREARHLINKNRIPLR